MSKDAEPKTSPKPAAEKTEVDTIHRVRIGLNVTVQIILGLALFLMVNVLAHRNFRQWDHTYSRIFTLADNTKKFLSEIKTPVQVTVLAPQDGSLERDMAPLLEQYQKEMKDRLKLNFIDTRRDTEAWQQFQIDLNKNAGGFKPPTEEGVFVQSQIAQKADSGSLAFHRWIPAQSVFVMDKVKSVPVAFRGESLMNTAIAEVTNPDRPKVGFVAGINNKKYVPGQGSTLRTYFNTFADICSAQNIQLEPWLILDNAEYAPSFRSLIVSAANLMGEVQEKDLSDFLETPGNSVMVLLDPNNGSPEIDRWLAKYGIQPRSDLVMQAHSTAGGIKKEYTVDAYLKEGSPITAGIENRAILLPGTTRSLGLLTNAEKVRTENIELTTVLTAGRDFWGETKFNEALPVFDEKEDYGLPLTVAATAERGAGDDLQIQSSRLVVVGNADLAMPDATAGSYEFLTRSMNWMLHRTETAPNDPITDKAKHFFKISMKPEQWKRVFLICTIVLPLAALMTGLLIWSARRN